MRYDPYWDKVVLALTFEPHGGDFSIIDLKGKTMEASQVQLQGTVKKNGLTALQTDNNGTLSTPHHSDFEFGIGDFTLEAWVYRTAIPVEDNNANRIAIIISKSTEAWSDPSIFRFEMFNSSLRFVANDSSVFSYSVPVGWQLNKWYHLAVSRSGNTLRMFIDGALVYEGSCADNLVGGDALNVGGRSYYAYNRGWRHIGFMDDVRVTKGVARYTQPFTPLASQIPAVLGSGVIQGQTLEAGVPVPRIVRVYNRETLDLVREVTTDANGQFSFDPEDSGPFIVVGLDDPTGTKYNAIVFDHITPVRA